MLNYPLHEYSEDDYFHTNIIFERLYRFLRYLIYNAGSDFEFIRLNIIQDCMIQRPAY